MPASGSGRLIGLVRTAGGGVYEVELHQGGTGAVVEASLRGRLKREERTGDAVVVGDQVVVERQEDGAYTIEGVEPRRTELARRAPRKGGQRAKVLVANVDQLVAVFAVASPAPRLRLLDRFLVLAESSGLDAVVVANKVDLVEPGPAARAGADVEEAARTLEALASYASLGYPVVRTSVKDGTGLEALRASICGRVTVFAGPSGVGKSSLLNALQPGLALRTAEVSAADKGRHTTVSARLIPLDCGGHVADTPGLRELGLWGVAASELDLCFPEFRPYLEECRFGRSCTHTHEPDCAVSAAVAAGGVPVERLESYRALLAGDEERY